MSRWMEAARSAGFSSAASSASSASSASLDAQSPIPAESAEPAESAYLLKHLSPDQLDAFEERAGIIEHDADLPRQEAETLAAQEQGHADADSLHGDVIGRWAAEIERLATLPAVSPEGGGGAETGASIPR